MVYEYAFKVRLHDVDRAGVMFFARAFVHAHDAYEEFMAHLGVGLSGVIDAGWQLPIVNANCDYRLPLRHGEEVAVTLAIARVGRTSFAVTYEFLGGGERRARVETTHVFLDPVTRRASSLPDALRKGLAPYRNEAFSADPS